MKHWLERYADHPDPLVATGNFIALVLAWNQPFYPLYLWFIVGDVAWVEAPDMLAGLFFFAIPAIARRAPMLGRALLPIGATINILLVSWLLGAASGVWLLLFPCCILTSLLFRWRESWWTPLMLALPPAAWWLATGRLLGAPPLALSSEQLASIWAMNAGSAFAAMLFFGFVFAKARPA